MKESKLIYYILLITTTLLTILSLLFDFLNPINAIAFNIVSNIYCGLFVGLITAITQYFAQRRMIINKVYNEYLEIYRAYYYSKNGYFLFHYNVVNIYKKMIELNPIISGYLDDYTGLFIKKDKMYMKMNPVINFNQSLKRKNILKTFKWFNKNEFQNTLEPLILEIEKILISINKKRFKIDKEEIKKIYINMIN